LILLYSGEICLQGSEDRDDDFKELRLTFASFSTSKNADDVVITYARRTALTKAGKGGFKDTGLDTLLFKLLKEVVKEIKIDPALVEDICLGNVNEGKAAYYIRAASLAAGKFRRCVSLDVILPDANFPRREFST
jgi:hypothetical protein